MTYSESYTRLPEFLRTNNISESIYQRLWCMTNVRQWFILNAFLPLQTFEQLSLCYHFQNGGSSSIPFNSGHSLSNSQLPIPLKVRASFLYGGIAAHAGKNQMTLIYPKTQMTNNRI